MPANIASAIVYIVNAVTSLLLLVLLLRFWLPLVQADFRNPLAQGILKFTSPIVIPVRRIVPSVGRIDSATVLVAFIIQSLAVLLLLYIRSATAPFSDVAVTAVIKLVVLSINLFIYAMFIRFIFSWFAPGQHNPVTAIITTLTEPVLRPLRRILPAMGGFDLSLLAAIILLTASTIVIGGLKPAYMQLLGI